MNTIDNKTSTSTPRLLKALVLPAAVALLGALICGGLVYLVENSLTETILVTLLVLLTGMFAGFFARAYFLLVDDEKALAKKEAARAQAMARSINNNIFSLGYNGDGSPYETSEKPDFNFVIFDLRYPHRAKIGQIGLPAEPGGTLDIKFGSEFGFTAYRPGTEERFVMKMSFQPMGAGTTRREIALTELRTGTAILFGENALVVARDTLEEAFADTVKGGTPELNWLKHLRESALVATQETRATSTSVAA